MASLQMVASNNAKNRCLEGAKRNVACTPCLPILAQRFLAKGLNRDRANRDPDCRRRVCPVAISGEPCGVADFPKKEAAPVSRPGRGTEGISNRSLDGLWVQDKHFICAAAARRYGVWH